MGVTIKKAAPGYRVTKPPMANGAVADNPVVNAASLQRLVDRGLVRRPVADALLEANISTETQQELLRVALSVFSGSI